MATQYDFSPGLDLTGIAAPTKAQLVQAISQIAPLSNIGGVVYSATAPDVANNARFARYMWIDIGVDGSPTSPVWKLYDGTNWNLATLAANSVTNTIIAAKAVTLRDQADANSKIAYRVNGAGVIQPGTPYALLRLDSAGEYVEAIALSTILSPSTVPLSSLNRTAVSGISGTPKTFLGIDAAGTSMGFYVIDDNALTVGSINGDKLVDGSVTYLKLTGAIPLSKLDVGAGTALQGIRVNTGATAYEFFTQPILQVKTFQSSDITGPFATTIADGFAAGAGSATVYTVTVTPKQNPSKFLIEGELSVRAEADGSDASLTAALFLVVNVGGAGDAIVPVSMRYIDLTNTEPRIIPFHVGYTVASAAAHVFTLRVGILDSPASGLGFKINQGLGATDYDEVGSFMKVTEINES